MFEKALAYARLLRLSNGPTAVADVWMGYAVVSGSLEPTWPLLLMSLASLCLYHGGMVLNDVVDVERDAKDNRHRPLPSGHVRLRTAAVLVGVLYLLAMLFSTLSILWSGNAFGVAPVIMLLFLSPAYDLMPRHSPISPFIMGGCRAFNVMLGMGAASLVLAGGQPDGSAGIRAAFGIFLYVSGVTWYARDEAVAPSRKQLSTGLAACVLGILFIALSAWFRVSEAARPSMMTWVAIWGAVALMATRGMAAAILQPTPRNIGRGVGIAIQGLVVIDATLAALYAGPVAGLAILALLPVTMLLARWIPQT